MNWVAPIPESTTRATRILIGRLAVIRARCHALTDADLIEALDEAIEAVIKLDRLRSMKRLIRKVLA